MYNYSDPFSCECRSYGRLQETGHEELAIKCFGYVLLDEEHEKDMFTTFSDLRLEFNGDVYDPGCEDMRGRFRGKDGRVPPIRGIVKELGQGGEDHLNPKLVRKVFRDVIKLQKLGIFNLDVAARQILNDKISDFSTAFTVPHYIASPELNPKLTPKMLSIMERSTFQLSLGDYLDIDNMVFEWNERHPDRKDHIRFSIFYNWNGCNPRYNLRSKTPAERVYTFFDPRKYDWKTLHGDAEVDSEGKAKRRQPGRISKTTRYGGPQGKSSRAPPRLTATPSMWYYDCESSKVQGLRQRWSRTLRVKFDYNDGLIYPIGSRYPW